ncbi:hypothetical protein BT96DRAFT_912228 [Gymnopus androsaceus JB14]|uniref:Uncharacterized protein n=1 Tax=Gymnopus androsaceus JB14 TaxID=1447944 RepID=A0A6A4ILL3_9AGAR|nr:hypothetical protein BT96DRAFT_912228 [Gymnopus androsaceus JB14]
MSSRGTAAQRLRLRLTHTSSLAPCSLTTHSTMGRSPEPDLCECDLDSDSKHHCWEVDLDVYGIIHNNDLGCTTCNSFSSHIHRSRAQGVPGIEHAYEKMHRRHDLMWRRGFIEGERRVLEAKEKALEKLDDVQIDLSRAEEELRQLTQLVLGRTSPMFATREEFRKLGLGNRSSSLWNNTVVAGREHSSGTLCHTASESSDVVERTDVSTGASSSVASSPVSSGTSRGRLRPVPCRQPNNRGHVPRSSQGRPGEERSRQSNGRRQENSNPRKDDPPEVWLEFLRIHAGNWPVGVRKQSNGDAVLSDLIASRMLAHMRPDLQPSPSLRQNYVAAVLSLFTVKGRYKDLVAHLGLQISPITTFRVFTPDSAESANIISEEDVARHYASCGVTVKMAEENVENWAIQYKRAKEEEYARYGAQ